MTLPVSSLSEKCNPHLSRKHEKLEFCRKKLFLASSCNAPFLGKNVLRIFKVSFCMKGLKIK